MNLNNAIQNQPTLYPVLMPVNTQEELIQVLKERIHVIQPKALVNKVYVRLNNYDPSTKERVLSSHKFSTMANSRMTRHMEFLAQDTVIDMDGCALEVGPTKSINYTTDLLSVDFSKVTLKDIDPDAVQSNIEYTADMVKSFGLYFHESTKEVYLPLEANNNTVKWCKNGNGSLVIPSNKVEAMKQACTHYMFFNWSNSEERGLKATMINATKYNEVVRFELLDTILGGSVKYHLELTNNKFAKIQKLATRIGLKNPADIELGTMGNNKWGVILCSKFQANNDLSSSLNKTLNERGIDLDDNIVDGEGILNAKFIVDVLEEQNVQVTEDIVSGLLFQCRNVGLGNKSADYVYRELVFRLFVEYLEKNYTLANTAEEFLALDSKKIKTYYIIGNKNNIAGIYDLNAAKIPNLDGSDFIFSILDIATAAKCAYTSGQQLSKSMYMDQEATCGAIYELTMNNLIGMLDGKFEDDMMLGQTGADYFYGLNKDRASTDILAVAALGNDINKYGRSMISKNRIAVAGGSYRAQFDNTAFLANNKDAYTLGVTPEGYVECYNPDLLKKNRKEIRLIEKAYKANLSNGMDLTEAREIMRLALNDVLVGQALKYPASGHFEFELFRPVTKLELKNRLFDGVAKDTDEEKLAKALYAYFTDCSAGCILLAPINILKHKLAGMDTDFDGLTVITENSLVSIAKDAYATTKLTGLDTIPGKTVILNKDNKDKQVVKELIDMVHANYNYELLIQQAEESYNLI